MSLEVKAAYWLPESGLPAESIDSRFTHLFYAFAKINPTTFQPTISTRNATQFATFSETVRLNNPDAKTLLSLGGNPDTFVTMSSDLERWTIFIYFSISLARSNGFDGLDIHWLYPKEPTHKLLFLNLVIGFWNVIQVEARVSGRTPLLLTAAVFRSPKYVDSNYFSSTMAIYLDFINVISYDFYGPAWSPDTTDAPAGLYPFVPGKINMDEGIADWILSGFPTKKIVIGLPYHGYAWQLVDPNRHKFASPSNGAVEPPCDGKLTYAKIKENYYSSTTTHVYDSTVVSNYCYDGTTWIGYDDVDSITAKVRYAVQKGLLGFFAWHLGAEDGDTTLSASAFEVSG